MSHHFSALQETVKAHLLRMQHTNCAKQKPHSALVFEWQGSENSEEKKKLRKKPMHTRT